MRLFGFRLLLPRRRTARSKVLFVDCGVHEQGFEICCLHRWFSDRYCLHVLAFEAGSRQFSAASRALSDISNLDFRHQALVGPTYVGSTATLYNWPVLPDGLGDSLFAVRGGRNHEIVPAARLSDVLRSAYGSYQGPLILRMNIEGAELFVIEDLIASGFHHRIDGFHGMWDDLSFIDPPKFCGFRRLLREHGIEPITFNGRDLEYALRRFAIRVDVQTSIWHGEMHEGTRQPLDSLSGPAHSSLAAPRSGGSSSAGHSPAGGLSRET